MYPRRRLYQPTSFCCSMKILNDVACWSGSGVGVSLEIDEIPAESAEIIEGGSFAFWSELLNAVSAWFLIDFALVLGQL